MHWLTADSPQHDLAKDGSERPIAMKVPQTQHILTVLTKDCAPQLRCSSPGRTTLFALVPRVTLELWKVHADTADT
jgi:hypothetical protein